MKTTTTSRFLAGLMALFGMTALTHAVDFHVVNAQGLQNALTLSAADGADDTIYLAAGYYTGNFNFNSTEAYSLTLLAEPGVGNDQVTLDGAGTGRTMSLSCSANAPVTVRGLTFLRNCGSSANAGLGIATGGGADILVDNCRFLSPASTSGTGLAITSGLNVTVSGCIAAGTPSSSGIGILMTGVSGDVNVTNCLLATNYGTRAALSISTGGAISVAGSTFNGNRGGSDGGFGGGAYCSSVTTLTLSSNTFNGNWTPGQGGGAYCYCYGTAFTLYGNTFTGNAAPGNSGGGAYCVGTTPTLSNNSFFGNSCWGGNGWSSGGGAFCSGTATLTGNTFSGNSVPGNGGGACFATGSPATLTGNTFSGNYANGPGGGTWCSGTATICGNTFTTNSTASSGGGIYCAASTALTNNTFTANSASQYGGGVCCSGCCVMTLAGNTAKRNTAGYAGGGFYVDSGTVNLLDNLVVGNAQTGSGYNGGGVWLRESLLYMINNTLFGNIAAGSGGGAAFQVDGTTEILHVYNNIIFGDTANGNGADVYLAGTGQRKEFLFNDTDDMYGVWDIATSDVDIDPQFFDPVNGDYHLRSASGCVNTGDNVAPSLPATDLDGGPRIVGATVDLGCYEFNNSLYHPADANTDWAINLNEFNAYGTAWLNSQPWTPGPNPISADFVTRAGFLLQSGGTYHNDGSAQPINWKPGTP